MEEFLVVRANLKNHPEKTLFVSRKTSYQYHSLCAVHQLVAYDQSDLVFERNPYKLDGEYNLGDVELCLVTNPNLALRISVDTPLKSSISFIEEIKSEIFRRYVTPRKNDEIEFRLSRVKVNPEIEDVDLNEGEFLVERQRRALSKLTSEDIAALKLENIATFVKLKFENVEEGDIPIF